MTNPDSVEKAIPTKEEMVQEAKKKIESIFDTPPENLREIVEERQNRMAKLEKELREKGIEPRDYLYWHILIGSTPSDEFDKSAPLDTPDGDIEKLINELAV